MNLDKLYNFIGYLTKCTLLSRVFLNPGQFGVAPVSGSSAFHRWLQILAAHDWNEDPLLVSPDMSFSEER